jgi:hypothetical protein
MTDQPICTLRACWLTWTLYPNGGWCADGDGFYVVRQNRGQWMLRAGELGGPGTRRIHLGENLQAALDAASMVMRAQCPDMFESLATPDPITAYYTDRANGQHAAKAP